ncbi:CLUMA_CG000082, isoform A [Clunio marinus]|uniref:CLUMA_CG000082, isoform A n=1 Tax=Clunio marinus TaxID=568069 RepID=A0A1J1HEH6_9DIPT|nr:CLUMA_CG000082, isoform A [Clunio marinus]
MNSEEEVPFWIPFHGEIIPKNTVKGGKENNQKLYIGRSHHHGSLTPGKVLESERNCIIPWGTISNVKEDFEILICSTNYNWVAAENGSVPINAFPAGHSEQGETLFIGRVFHEGSLIVGKIQQSHRVCYIPHNDEELNFCKYEVLVV